MIVYGLNPVLEAIRARGDQVRYVGVASAEKGRLAKLIGEAKAAGIPVRTMSVEQIRRLASAKTHNRVIAEVEEAPYLDFDELIRRPDAPERVFILDGVQDPQNLGAILRVAEGFGFGLVILPKHDSVALSATAVKASAGAAEWVGVSQVTNLARTIDALKKRGYWVFAADAGGDPVSTVDFGNKVVLVLGSEGRGVRRNVLEHSDARVAIPMRGNVNSLNVATAAAVLAYEVDRQGGRNKPKG